MQAGHWLGIDGSLFAVPSLGPVAVELLHPEDIDGVKKAFEKFILRVVASKRAPR